MNERDHSGKSTETADERKLVTVVFADISGFTALSQDMDPEDVRALMNRCFDALVPAIDAYGGTVDKFIGDEIMAIFGAPVAYEDHAGRALQAALDMQSSLVHFNEREGSQLAMHVGVNTGTVLAGGVGSLGRRQYSVMGDVVNLAARLKDAAAIGTILVGPATFRLGTPLFAFDGLEPLTLKGRSAPVAVYRLKGLATDGAKHEIAILSSPLVGRESELSTLRSAVDGLASGKGSVTSIVGDPGLGKSRLVLELRRSVGAGVRWGEGRALSHADRMNYAIARDLLLDLFRDEGESPSVELPPATAPYLRRLAGLPLATDEARDLEGLLPEALQRRMHQAFREYVRALCKRGPVVLAWDDLHWADPSSLSLLETLVPLVAEEPLLLLLAFRDGDKRLAEWLALVRSGREDTHRIVALEPLGPDESDRLVDSFPTQEAMPAETRRSILAQAEGNPFFLEELLSSFVADGPLDRLQVPDTLNGVIAARIDRLPPAEKRLLQTASVFGRSFARVLLAGLLEEDEAGIEIDGALVELTRRGLLRRQAEGEFIFKHALTHEVTYGGVLKSRRRALHDLAAKVTAAVFPTEIEERSAELGFHYERAERRERAAAFLAAAADRALLTFSNAEAIAFYRAAVEQIRLAADSELPARDRRARAADLHERIADTCTQIGRQEEAREALNEVAALLEENDRVGRSRLHRKEGSSLVADRQPVEAIEAFDRADAALGHSPADQDPAARREWIEIQLARGWGDYWLGRTEQLAAGAERVRPFVERDGSAQQRANFFRNVVLAAFRRDRYVISDQVLAQASLAVEAATESLDPLVVAHSTFMLGFCHLWRSECEEAVSVLGRALRLAERIGDAERVVLCLSYLAVVHRKRGDISSVRTVVERALTAATESRMGAYVALGRANQAWLAWRHRDLAATRDHGLAALSGWGQLSFPARGFALWPLTGSTLAKDRLAEAIDHVRAMLAPDQMRLPPDLETEMEAALRAWQAGDRQDALTRLETASAAATRLGFL